MKNYNPEMAYRRFGKTGELLSVISLGGMRFLHGWEEPRTEIPADSLAHGIDIVQRALTCGINNIDTAYSYRKSETLLGKVLNDELNVSRDDYYLMTKGAPMTPEEVRPLVEEQLTALQTDFFDFYGWHGINNNERHDIACGTEGVVHELLKLKEEGLIRHVGFTTHGPLELIIKSIETNLFEYMSVHYYYINQRNFAAIQLAATKDMGVLIISPNDKGGMLYAASDKMKSLTAPYSPIQWNARFCLKTPYTHTLAFGMNHAGHFEEMKGLFPLEFPRPLRDREIERDLDQQFLELSWGEYDGYDLANDPSGINVPEYLRYLKLAKCLDLGDFAERRYNNHSPENHWVPGAFPTEENLARMDESLFPEGVAVKALLREAHELLYKEKPSESS